MEKTKEEAKETEVKRERPKRQSPKDVFIKRREPTVPSNYELVSNLLKFNFNYQKKQLRQFSMSIDPEVSDDNFELKNIIFTKIKKDIEDKFKHVFKAGNSFFAVFLEKKEAKFTTRVNEVDYTIIVKPTDYKIDLSQIKTTENDDIKIRSLINHIIKELFQANPNFVRFDNGGYFDASDSNYTKLENRRAVSIPGFNTACCITLGGLVLRVNDDRRYLSGVSCYEIYKKIEKEKGRNSKELKDRFRHCSVITNYGKSKKVHFIEGIEVDATPRNTTIQAIDNGKLVERTLVEFYLKEYKKKIKDVDQPLLIFKPDKRSQKVFYLVPELCDMCGIDETVDNVGDANDMKKKLEFIDNTNWMFNSNFDVHFLQR